MTRSRRTTRQASNGHLTERACRSLVRAAVDAHAHLHLAIKRDREVLIEALVQALCKVTG